jgi:hypothetical protein
LLAQQSPSAQQAPSGQHVAFAETTVPSQHGPPGQQIPSGQQDSVATTFAAAQHGPSGQQAPSGQHAAACGSAFSAGVVNAPLHAAVLKNATATKATSANSLLPMIRFSEINSGLVGND